ncbi:MAG: response regulator transcription factor [Dehalococcoidales bacterium]|nr:response regulator transcription factor [Dehalococcoidales bacterium]
MNQKIIILIIDKQALFGVGVRHSLSKQSDFEVLDSTPGERFIELNITNLPDVLLIDIDYPSLNGFNLARNITLRYPAIKIIMLTSNPHDEELLEVIKVGAMDYLDKNITAENLATSIRRVSNGEYPINDSILAKPNVAKYVLKQFQGIYNGQTIQNTDTPLTSRESQILNYVANGNSNKQIAQILEISEQTIKNHISNILRKLNANDRAHAVVLAIRYGWISIEKLNATTYSLS